MQLFDVAVQFFVCCSAASGPNDFRIAEKPMLQPSFCSAAFRKLQRNFSFRLWHVAGVGFRTCWFCLKEWLLLFQVLFLFIGVHRVSVLVCRWGGIVHFVPFSACSSLFHLIAFLNFVVSPHSGTKNQPTGSFGTVADIPLGRPWKILRSDKLRADFSERAKGAENQCVPRCVAKTCAEPPVCAQVVG